MTMDDSFTESRRQPEPRQLCCFSSVFTDFSDDFRMNYLDLEEIAV